MTPEQLCHKRGSYHIVRTTRWGSMLQNADRNRDFFSLACCASQCSQVREEQIKTFFGVTDITSEHLCHKCGNYQILRKGPTVLCKPGTLNRPAIFGRRRSKVGSCLTNLKGPNMTVEQHKILWNAICRVQKIIQRLNHFRHG